MCAVILSAQPLDKKKLFIYLSRWALLSGKEHAGVNMKFNCIAYKDA